MIIKFIQIQFPIFLKKIRSGCYKMAIIVAFLLIASPVLGASLLYEDSFNSYTNGDLLGQGNSGIGNFDDNYDPGWVRGFYGSDIMEIQTTNVVEGKAVKMASGSNFNIYNSPRMWATDLDGYQGMYIKKAETDKSFMVAFSNEKYPSGSNHILIIFDDTGHIITLNNDTSTTIQPYIADRWYFVFVEWRVSDRKYRVSIDGGTPTEWLVCYYGENPADLRSMYFQASANSTTYMDLLSAEEYVPPAVHSIEIDYPTENFVSGTSDITYEVMFKNDSEIYNELALSWYDGITTTRIFRALPTQTPGYFKQVIGSVFLSPASYVFNACMTATGEEDLCATPVNFSVSVGAGGVGDQNIPPVFEEFGFDYTDYSPFETPSATFTFLTNSFNSILNPVNTWANYFARRFDFSILNDQSSAIKENIKSFRSYLNAFDSFFSDLPVSLFLTLLIVIIIGKSVFMLSYRIIGMIKP